jgi:hypothetical protein
LVVNFTHFDALCFMEASKFRQIAYICHQTQGEYI